ncbi:MAG: type II and III secretion system protein, partial [Candidatus Obscuribacterales bacterium]|nr:type II and III secretion system protein [Candidatus Obscuribacterales bacterium]
LGKSAGGRFNVATMPGAINVNVNMLLQTNKAKIIANPSLVVSDNTEALITIANEVLHKITSTVSLGVVTTNVEIEDAGIFLNVLPNITEDGFVRVRLRPQVSTPLGPPTTFGQGTNQTTVTLLSKRDLITQEVRIKDGQTLVIGGLFTEIEASQLSKVPYLAEAPVLGAFFRTTLKGRNRTELMLLITPKIVEEDPSRLSDSGSSPTL